MASSSRKSTEKDLHQRITDQFLVCHICLESFDHPKSLPCLHTFCYHCLSDYAKTRQSNNKIICPVCRKWIDMPDDGVDGFATSFMHKNLEDVLSDSGKLDSPPICTNCETDASVTYCKECCDYLCIGCLNAHKRTKQTRNHTYDEVVNIPKFKKVENKAGSESGTGTSAPTTGAKEAFVQKLERRFCSEHKNERFITFCTDCWKLLCLDCLPSHVKQDHNLSGLHKVYDKFVTAAEAKIEIIESKISILEDDMKEATVIRNELLEDKSKAVENIERVVSMLQNHIELCKKDRLEKLNTIETGAREAHSNYMEQHQQCVASLKLFRQIVQGYIREGNIEALKSVSSEVLTKFKTTCKVKCGLILHQPTISQKVVKEWVENQIGILQITDCFPGFEQHSWTV